MTTTTTEVATTDPAEVASKPPTAAARRATDRASAIRAGLTNYSETIKLIAAAYKARDWEALGYKTWASYATAEYGGQVAGVLKAEERAKITVKLGEAGLTVRAIAAATGTAKSTVARDLAGADVTEVSDSGTAESQVKTGLDGRARPAKQPKATTSSVKLDTPPGEPASAEADTPATVELQQRSRDLVREVKAVAALAARANGGLAEAARLKVAGWLGEVADAAAEAANEVVRGG